MVENSHLINLTYKSNLLTTSRIDIKKLEKNHMMIIARIDYLDKCNNIEKINSETGFLNLILKEKIYDLLINYNFVRNLSSNINVIYLITNLIRLYKSDELMDIFMKEIFGQISLTEDTKLIINSLEILFTNNIFLFPECLVFIINKD